MSAPSNISIIIPAFNQLMYCEQCITTLLANTRPPYKLILVDNGSTDGVGPYFDSIPGAKVIHFPENRGFAAGVNAGLEHAEGHALLLNSDTLLPVGWLERLEAALLEADDIGMAGPVSNCVSGPQQIEGFAGSTLDDLNLYAADLARRNAGMRREVNRLVGFCLLIRDRVLQEVGRFDEAFGIGNFEDDDYALRVRKAGYRMCIVDDAFVFHYGSRTFVGMGIEGDQYRALITTNERIFLKKWAGAISLTPPPEPAQPEMPPPPAPPAQNETGLEIRPYQPSDRDEWMRVHAVILSISHAWNYTIQERPQYEGYESTQLVALYNGHIVGLTDVQYENTPGELCFLKDSRGGYVLEFGRLPEYSGMNLGRRLIDAAIEDAKRKGFHRLEYWTQDRNAQRFYRRLGMPEIGRHYRFRMRPPKHIAEQLSEKGIGIEYLYCACLPEEWPIIKSENDIVTKPPLEPHLCTGFEVRF